MKGFLIAEEGPLAHLIVRMDEGNEWVIGRDPDASYQVLEDPMVSRKAVRIYKTEEGFVLENLSTTNPASINGKPINVSELLVEGDTVQIGSTLFRFTNQDPAGTAEEEPLEEETTEEPQEAPGPGPRPELEEEPVSDIFGMMSFSGGEDTRWMIKVISGPNAGAEFNLEPGQSLTIGKDPNNCDVTLQDLSVSRQHARITVSDNGENVTIEDLNSRNGTLISGKAIEEAHTLNSQDLVALGTTSFLVIDREQTRDTIFSPPTMLPEPEPEEVTEDEAIKAKKKWRELIIPNHHLILAGIFAVLVLVGVGGILSLFKSETIVVEKHDESGAIRKSLKQFPSVEFSYNETTGKVFLLGHVLTEIDHQEMIYNLSTLEFINGIEDNVTIDELVWDNVNALLMKNPNWRSISMTGKTPGIFLLRGYVDTAEEDAELKEYLNLNFNYLDKLDYQVVIERTLEMEVQAIMIQEGFAGTSMQLTGGDLIIAGRVSEKQERKFEKTLDYIRKLHGIHSVKSVVIFTTAQTARIDLTSRYRVTGTTKFGNAPQYVVIGGKILSSGDTLDGMTITRIIPDEVLLEKDGLKYKINYNEQ